MSHEKVCKNKDFFGTVMLSEKNNTLILNQYAKSIHEDKCFTLFILTLNL